MKISVKFWKLSFNSKSAAKLSVLLTAHHKHVFNGNKSHTISKLKPFLTSTLTLTAKNFISQMSLLLLYFDLLR